MDTAQIRALMEEQLTLSRRLRARVEELEEARHAPVAVVGMGLRLPSGTAEDIDSPEGYWDFLRSGANAQSELPDERPGLRAVYDPVPGTPGRSYVSRAGFLTDIAHFDADFFGISAREARFLDPQQRMLLETAWEALERAAIPVQRSARLDVGVYLGMMASEYSERLEDRADTTRIDPYYTTGGGLCFGAGRIGYVMGFRGPVVSVDTACSSSLSALHLAVRGLRDEECRYALVCGSNLLLSANLMVSLSQTRALSPDGRSKSFLASADGYGRAEGVGALALMRLADARREGRPVLAVVRGTAVNHDGAASGLTAPNGPAQQEVIRAALADARTDPAELGWIEAHGTGTVLGDPIEIGALDNVVGEAVRERGTPLALGSVKARLGHLEAASGIAALMKTVLMLRHGEIPSTLSDDDGELNPHIPWDRLPFEVPRSNRPWPPALPHRVAGVNSFGMSGTNAHVVVAAYEDVVDEDGARPAESAGSGGVRTELLSVSAKDEGALQRLAERVRTYLKGTDTAMVSSVCHTLRTGRAVFGHRLAVTGTTAAELAEALQAALEQRPRAGQAAVAAPPDGPATLRVTSDAERLARGVAVLADAFPGLARHGEVTDDDPARRLTRMLGSLGVRVAIAPGEPAQDASATLDWGPEASRILIPDSPEGATARLQATLAALFTAGAELRFDALRAPGARLLGDLPTYPFARRRHWLDEPAPGTRAAGVPDGDATPRPDLPAAHDRAAVRAYLLAELADVLQSADPLDPQLSFLETGGDSFLSTLFITRVEAHYAVSLTPEELPLDLPLTELFGRLSDDIAATAATAEPEVTGI
ncbi:beta-ketoacyl synthase N-terminal-like domain-containing protein [Streptomyces sp. NPDC101151]|uniref:beta-ketoacyl synthase N-terminal-like domain-containing protein n=1 Tax=Streptomyces sp. NPDC101151 TaxID=3366115 RepID=UPI003803C6FF